jgi:hypothetical protein
MKKIVAMLMVCCLTWTASKNAAAQVTVTIDSGASWLGFMNVFNLPADGGAYQFGSPWGVGDLVATFSGPVLTLAPNTIGDPNPYWYQGGGGPGSPGNKIMAASMYQEPAGSLPGVNLTFTGEVLSNTFTSAHSTVAFIKDFAPDYSSSVTTMVPLTSPGVFSVSLATINDPARHVQFGFETTGVNVWATDVAPFGSIQIIGIPEPTTLALSAASVVGLFLARRRSV